MQSNGSVIFTNKETKNNLISDIEGSPGRLHAHGVGALGEVKTLKNLADAAVDQGHGPVLAGRN